MTRHPADKLLREAAGALQEELDAAGYDEVKGHPTLRAHARLVARINRYLKSAEKVAASGAYGKPKAKAPRRAAADLELAERGGVLRVTPLTPAGRDWLDENIHAEVHARLGAAVEFLVDVSRPLRDGAKRAGIRIRTGER